MNTFVNAMDDISNHTLTENGADALSSTGSALLDLFGVIGALRTRPSDVKEMFDCAFGVDPLNAMKLSFYARDVRGGLGEREVPRTIWHWMAYQYPDVMEKNLAFVPFFGRWDDLYAFVGTPLEANAFALMLEQAKIDVVNGQAGRSVTLLGKWLKSVNTSSKESVRLGKLTARYFDMKENEYRKMCSFLRARANIVERKISAGQWEEIDYSTVPSRAMMILRKAFQRHDADGFAEYMARVSKGEAKIHADTLYPYDIFHRMGLQFGYNETFRFVTPDSVLEAQWNALPNFVGEGGNVIVVADTSSSMKRSTCGSPFAPIESSLALAVYFAERNTGVYHNRFITFSSRPSWVILNGGTLAEKVKNIPSIVDNTDLHAVFELILGVAVRDGIAPEEMPNAIVVVSDMEIDDYQATDGILPSTFTKQVKRDFKAAGYELPSLVYWNVNSRHNVFHANSNEPNTMLASGQSPSVFRDVINAIGLTPYEAMLKVLGSERYACIQV